MYHPIYFQKKKTCYHLLGTEDPSWEEPGLRMSRLVKFPGKSIPSNRDEVNRKSESSLCLCFWGGASSSLWCSVLKGGNTSVTHRWTNGEVNVGQYFVYLRIYVLWISPCLGSRVSFSKLSDDKKPPQDSSLSRWLVLLEDWIHCLQLIFTRSFTTQLFRCLVFWCSR